MGTAVTIAAVIGIAIGAIVSSLWFRAVIRRAVVGERLAERRARANERLAELGSMTGGLAHEIKNPLSTIGLNAQLLAEAIEDLGIDPAERARLTRRIEALRRETDRLRGILEDFLEYAGELHLDLRSADLNQTVEELVDFFHPQAESNGVRLRSDLAEGPLIAPLDVPHLKQAALNLMLNAVQAMAAADGSRPRELILRTERGEDHSGVPTVSLHVIDTGPGIPEENREKIFHPYHTSKPGGSGLGLPTTRRIVEAHAGHIELYSTPDAGTDFTMTFPAPPIEPAQS